MNNLALQEINPVEIKLKATALELCESASDTVIMTRPDLSHATDLVKTIKSRFKEIEDERKRIVKPFNDGVDAINGRFKGMTGPLLEAEAALKGKMLAFQKEEEKRANDEAVRVAKIQAEAAEKARQEAEEHAKANPEADDISSMPLPEKLIAAAVEVNMPIHRPTTYGQTGAVSTVKKVWAFEVTDIKALANARPDLVMVDTVKINQLIRGVGGEIPGLRIFQNETMSVR